jgi:hypothetical protein
METIKEATAANMMTVGETQKLGLLLSTEIEIGYRVVRSAVATNGFVS